MLNYLATLICLLNAGLSFYECDWTELIAWALVAAWTIHEEQARRMRRE